MPLPLSRPPAIRFGHAAANGSAFTWSTAHSCGTDQALIEEAHNRTVETLVGRVAVQVIFVCARRLRHHQVHSTAWRQEAEVGIVRAHPLQAHEILFGTHQDAFRVLGGVPRRGIYDNMKTSVTLSRSAIVLCKLFRCLVPAIDGAGLR